MSSEAKQLGLQAPRIFLSYAREDQRKVSGFYRELTKRGLNPWFDVTDLEPGHDWQQVIGSAIKKARFVLLFLSNESVQKQGYFQREISEALRIAETIPEGQRFIIPVRLEDCHVPDRLSNWHWVDAFRPHGRRRLLETLQRSLGVSSPTRPVTLSRQEGEASKKESLNLYLVAKFMERGQFLMGRVSPGKFAVSDGAMLEILPTLPRAMKNLRREMRKAQRLTPERVRSVVPEKAVYQNVANVAKVIRITAIPYYLVLESNSASRCAVDPDYLIYALRKYPKATLYLPATSKLPVVVEQDAEIRCLIMPMNLGDKALQAF
jgi:hypothetical protein